MMAIDLTDAIDLHVHTSPDVYDRSVDDLELSRQAAAAGMKALLLKSHHTLTADRAELAAKQVGIAVFGGVVLNQTVGGLNPVAAETAIEFGAKQIWMPTVHAKHCMDVADSPMFRAEVERGRTGIVATDGDGEITDAVGAILEIIRDADVILGTGHLAPDESIVVLAAARDMGITKMLVTHPLMSFTRFSPDQMNAAAELGALLEFDYLSCSPTWHHAVDPDATAEAMRRVGPDRCVMATDGGQRFNPDPPKMLEAFAAAMSARGIGDDDLRTMTCRNPARLLGV